MTIFKQLRLALRLGPILEKEEKLMRMKLTTSTSIQIILGVVQIVNLMEPYLGAKGKVIAGAGVGVLQIVVNTISHLSNPDGTDAKTAYVPK